MQLLRLETATLTSFNKRYEKLIKEVQEQGVSGPGGNLSEGVREGVPGQKGRGDALNLEVITQQLYKYGEHGQPLQQPRDAKSDLGGQLTATTPQTNFNYRTHMSFLGAGRGVAPQFVDTKKLDGINALFSKVFRQGRALDSIIMQLQMIKSIFKA